MRMLSRPPLKLPRDTSYGRRGERRRHVRVARNVGAAEVHAVERRRVLIGRQAEHREAGRARRRRRESAARRAATRRAPRDRRAGRPTRSPRSPIARCRRCPARLASRCGLSRLAWTFTASSCAADLRESRVGDEDILIAGSLDLEALSPRIRARRRSRSSRLRRPGRRW